MFQFALKLPEINRLLLKHQKPIPKLQTPSDLNYWETLRTDFTQQMSIDVGNLHYPSLQCYAIQGILRDFN